MSSLPAFSELIPFVIGLLCAGAVAGFLAGMFGIGGGAVLVPVFYQMLGLLGVDEAVRMHLSVGTSLAIIAPTSVRSFLGSQGKGRGGYGASETIFDLGACRRCVCIDCRGLSVER